MSVTGTSIPQFDVPVCNIFQSHVLHGRLCYQVDVNKVRDKIDIQRAMKTGLIFALDYNPERMFSRSNVDISPGLTQNLYELQNTDFLHHHEEATVHVDTLGRSWDNMIVSPDILFWSVLPPHLK